MTYLIPSYQKVFAREGVSSGVELAVIGSAESVTRSLNAYLDAGATDVALLPLRRGRPNYNAYTRWPQTCDRRSSVGKRWPDSGSGAECTAASPPQFPAVAA